MVQGDDEWADTLGGVTVAKAEEEDISFIDIPDFREVLGAIDFDVWIATEDVSKAGMVADGFRYLLQMEFQRKEPLLSFFYELNFTDPSLDHGGSYHYRDRGVVRLKKEYKKMQKEVTKLRTDLEEIHNDIIDLSVASSLREIAEQARQQLLKEKDKSLKKRLLAAISALWIAMAPITTAVADRALDEIFPPIQAQTEQQLQRDQAPMSVTVKLEYPEPDYDKFPVDGFST